MKISMNSIIGVGSSLILCTCLFSCKESVTGPSASSLDFPLTVGSTWTYATFDSLSLARDTVVLTIVGTTTETNASSATQWRYASSGSVDTFTVARFGDTLEFNTFRLPPTFVFPLTVGKAWKTQMIDSFEVTGQMMVSLPSPLGEVIAYQATIVHQQTALPNSFVQHDYWVVPGIGIVAVYEQGFNSTVRLERTKTVWTLVSYSITP